MKRIVALLLAMVMVLGLVACGGGGGNGDTPNQEPTTTPSEPSEPGDTPEDSEGEDEGEAESLGFPVTYDEDVLYEYNFGEFMEYYTAAKEADDLDVRRAMMAVAEDGGEKTSLQTLAQEIEALDQEYPVNYNWEREEMLENMKANLESGFITKEESEQMLAELYQYAKIVEE